MSEKLPDLVSPEERKRIAAAINERATRSCQRCGHGQFVLIDGYLGLSLTEKPSQLNIGGQMVPCVATACTNCGAINFHSIGILKLIPDTGKPE